MGFGSSSQLYDATSSKSVMLMVSELVSNISSGCRILTMSIAVVDIVISIQQTWSLLG